MRTTRSVIVASIIASTIGGAALAQPATAEPPTQGATQGAAQAAEQNAAPTPSASTPPTPAPSLATMGVNDFVIITPENAHTLGEVIKAMNAQNRGTILIDDKVPMAPLPERIGDAVRVIDFRSNGGINVIRGHHPRRIGQWPQYSGLKTGLGKNVVLTDVVTPRTPIETWEGVPMPPQKTDFARAQDYAHYHNHYQNLLIETWNFTDNVNAVSLWADSAALTPGARSWGGFISARSWPFRWGEYLPEGAPNFADPEFDAALVGLEIDVLNFGLAHGQVSPTVKQPLSKIGLQLVGFGQQSTAAVEIRSVDTDAFELNADQRSGTWYYGIIANNCFNSESTFIKAAFDRARIGLDFSITDYTQGAIKIRSGRAGSGFMVNEGSSGEIYGGPRFADNADQRNWMHLRSGDGGTRIVSRDTKRELLIIDEAGNVSIPGSLTLAGKKIDAAKLAALLDGPLMTPPQNPPSPTAPVSVWSGPTRVLALGAGAIMLALMGTIAWMAHTQRQMRRQIALLAGMRGDVSARGSNAGPRLVEAVHAA